MNKNIDDRLERLIQRLAEENCRLLTLLQQGYTFRDATRALETADHPYQSKREKIPPSRRTTI